MTTNCCVGRCISETYLDVVALIIFSCVLTTKMQCRAFLLALLDISEDLVVLRLAVMWALIGFTAEVVANSDAVSSLVSLDPQILASVGYVRF